MSFETPDSQSNDDFDFDIDDVATGESSKDSMVFTRLGSTELKCVGLILFCVASTAFGLVMFLLHAFVIAGNNQMAMHASSTLPILMGFFAGSAAWSLLSTPTQVRVNADGIEIGKAPGRIIPWEQVSGVIVDTHNGAWGGAAKSIRLMNSNGKLIVRIGGAMQNFNRLIEIIQDSTQQTMPQEARSVDGSPDATALRLGRRRAMLIGMGAVMFGSATIFLAYDGWWNLQAKERMASEGVDGTGTVIRHFMAPNGITRRIEYEVHGNNGTIATHNVEIEKELHERLNVGDEVQIRYVPDDPEISHLAAGEIREKDDFLASMPAIVLLSCAGLAISIGMAVMTVVSWKGYDIKVDGTNVRMMPLGK